MTGLSSTATPTFIIELIKKREFPVYRFEEGLIAGKEIEESHEIDNVDLTTLLYQTGYLTIREYDENSKFYHLGFPNEEVRRSFFEHLLHGFSKIESSEINSEIFSLSKAVEMGDLESFVESLNRSQMPVSRKIYKLALRTGYSIAAAPLKTLKVKSAIGRLLGVNSPAPLPPRMLR